MRIAAAIVLACLLPTLGLPVVQKKRPASAANGRKPAAAAKGKKAVTSAAAKKGASGKRSQSARKGARPNRRARQLSPTPRRYQQIQEALATKGYLKAAPSGVWNSESTDALRRFQADQNLEPTGKLNSLSLIALGLGPKRETASVAPAAPR